MGHHIERTFASVLHTTLTSLTFLWFFLFIKKKTQVEKSPQDTCCGNRNCATQKHFLSVRVPGSSECSHYANSCPHRVEIKIWGTETFGHRSSAQIWHRHLWGLQDVCVHPCQRTTLDMVPRVLSPLFKTGSLTGWLGTPQVCFSG